jgi:hypothetical protein
MASTYTVLGTQLMATGENAGTWGTKTNTNLNIIEQIAGGYIEVAVTSTPTTLSVSDGSTGAALAHRCITFTGSISENTVVTIPLDVQTFYIIKNSVSGSYSVQFKYVSGSGSSVTWASGDAGTKIIYATADDGTNPNIVDATSAFVTATSTTTLTNKTLTSPKIGTSILDTNGNELALLTATGSAVNEFTIANAATGGGPTLSSTGGDSNIDINVTPKGTGDVVLSADTVTVGDAAAAATIRSSGAGTLTVTTGGATDLILSTNNGTTSGTITITDAANGDINIAPNGTGEVQAGGSVVNNAGTQTIWVPAQAMFGTTTNGADAQAVETTATRPELKVLDFDASTAEYAQFSIAMPKSWNLGTVTFQVFWSPSTTNTGNCIFGLQGLSCTEGDTADAVFGTAQEVTDAGIGTVEDVQMTSASSAMTIAGSPADDDYTFFQLYRDAADGSDTFTGDARVMGIKLFYTTDAANDA